jgi:hypothetical protein
MKKNIIKVAFVAAFALIAGYNVYSSQKTDMMSDLALANVEALASCEWTGWIGEYRYHIDLINYCHWTCTSGGYFQCPT